MKPNLIVVAGPNDSGKTTITEKLLRCYLHGDISHRKTPFGKSGDTTTTKETGHSAESLKQALDRILCPQKTEIKKKREQLGILSPGLQQYVQVGNA